jgi:hypothetical protein
MAKKPRYKKANKSVPSNYMHRSAYKHKQSQSPLRRINKLVLWLAATLGLVTGIWNLFNSDVTLEYLKPVGRGYEFKLTNNTIFNKQISYFKVSPEENQQFSFKITENVNGKFTDEGVELPGGIDMYIPSHEYKALDGKVIDSNSEIKFRIPPLISRSYLTPEAMMVVAHYELRSKNKAVKIVESIFDFFGLYEPISQQKYLVIENYWTPVDKENKETAFQSACRDNDMLSKTSICTGYNN